MTTLEIAVTSVEDAIQAAAGGAESIELSYDLAVGGLTPDLRVMQAVRDAITIPLYVILRPHAEHFQYSPEQIEGMLGDIEVMVKSGIDGIVFGAVNDHGSINTPLMQQIAKASSPVPITLHRAIDGSREPEAALEELKGIIPRVLTSGPAVSAWEGKDGLRRWIELFGHDYTFVSSGSLTAEQLTDYIRWVNPYTVHLGSAARTNGMVDSEKVRRLKVIVSEASL